MANAHDDRRDGTEDGRQGTSKNLDSPPLGKITLTLHSVRWSVAILALQLSVGANQVSKKLRSGRHAGRSV